MAERLYEMSLKTAQLYEMFSDGLIDEQTFNDTVEGMGVIEKVESYCQVINSLNAEIEMFQNEMFRLAKGVKARENSIEWLKGQLLNFYHSNGNTKIKAGTFVVSVRKSQSVDISDNCKIPEKYCTVKVSPNKTALKKALADGEVIDGVNILEKENVQIK